MFHTGEVVRMYRGVRRRINNGKPLDSYPFLSGDSFFFSCKYYFDSSRIQAVPSMRGRKQKENSLFVKIAELGDFILFLDKNPDYDFSNFSLVLHNGDESISKNLWELLANRFRNISSVNFLGSHPAFTPIPIGLENRKYFTNGLPMDYQKLLKSGVKETADRQIHILEAFSLHTNPAERSECSRVARKLGSKKLERATRSEYRRALAGSKYVLSPAGNGIDCHRTWEAMYLGAIPILRREHWPFVDQNLPVILVEEWEDLLKLDLNDVNVPRNSTWSENFWNSFYNDEQ